MKQVFHVNRSLPVSGTMLAQSGMVVDPDTIVAMLDYIPGAMQRLEIAQQLGVDAKGFRERVTLHYGINDFVAKDAVLAENELFFCIKEVRSPIDGYVTLISPHQGAVYLRSVSLPAEGNQHITLSARDLKLSSKAFIQDFIPFRLHLNRTGTAVSSVDDILVMAGQRLFMSNEMVAPYTCRVVDFSESEGVIKMVPIFQTSKLKASLHGYVKNVSEAGVCQIASYGHKFVGAVGYGNEQSGPIFPIGAEGNTVQPLDLTDKVLSQLQGKIVVARGDVSLDALQMLERAGISGLVLGSLDLDVLRAFSGHNPLQRMGQLMTMPYPIVLMQGFKGTMPLEEYRTMASLGGRLGLIDASTQLRAGVTRPTLLVPLVEELDAKRDHILNSESPIDFDMPLQPGDRVMILREPHSGDFATILEIGSKLEMTDVGIMTVLAKLRLVESKAELKVALSNCRKSL